MKRKLSLILLCGVMLLGATGCVDYFIPVINKNVESNEFKIADDTLQEIEEQITNMENIETAKVLAYGRAIDISISYVDNISSEYIKNDGVKILRLFDQDIIDKCDFMFDMNSLGYADCSAYKSYDDDDINWDCYDYLD